MSQEQAKVVAPQTQPAKAPVKPSTPMPIDPALLRHISGGDSTCLLPGKGW
jgi:hypothetical protein